MMPIAFITIFSNTGSDVPRLHLAQEVLLEPDLGEVHPLALGEPVGVARRDLRQRDERDAGVAEVGEADGVPRRARVSGSRPSSDGADVVRGRRHHRLDHVAGLRRARRHRRRLDRRDRDADADRIDVPELRVALELVDQDEAARVGQPVDAEHRVDALERRQHHRVAGTAARAPSSACPSSSCSVTNILPGLDARRLGVADPLDVALAHRRLRAGPWSRRRRRGRGGRCRVRR